MQLINCGHVLWICVKNSGEEAAPKAGHPWQMQRHSCTAPNLEEPCMQPRSTCLTTPSGVMTRRPRTRSMAAICAAAGPATPAAANPSSTAGAAPLTAPPLCAALLPAAAASWPEGSAAAPETRAAVTSNGCSGEAAMSGDGGTRCRERRHPLPNAASNAPADRPSFFNTQPHIHLSGETARCAMVHTARHSWRCQITS